MAYVIYRDDREYALEDLLFFGLQSTGELARDLEYWAQIAHVRGDEQSNDISGFGIDPGAIYVLDLPFQPSITISDMIRSRNAP